MYIKSVIGVVSARPSADRSGITTHDPVLLSAVCSIDTRVSRTGNKPYWNRIGATWIVLLLVEVRGDREHNRNLVVFVGRDIIDAN